MTPAQIKALKDYEDSVRAYTEGVPAQYDEVGMLISEDLGASGMASITTDPKYKEHELAALRELEDQSKNGFTARDRADMAQVENQVNRANRGRLGAIQQNMQARGMNGSGMDMVAQMQSSQDANEIAAMRALEQEAMIQERKSGATRDLGSMAANLQGRDFGQAAAKAQAQDQINQFNNANRNDAKRANLSNRQNVSNLNVGGANDFSQNVMSAKTGLAQIGYNAATEDENRRLLAAQERERKRAAKQGAIWGTVGAVGGGVVGGIYGGPAGAAAGAQAGGAVGTGAATAFGSDKRLKKDVSAEDEASIESFLNSLSPKSYSYKDEDKPRHGVLAQDLAKSKIGSDMLRSDDEGMAHVDHSDAISALLQAVAHLNKKTKG